MKKRYDDTRLAFIVVKLNFAPPNPASGITTYILEIDQQNVLSCTQRSAQMLIRARRLASSSLIRLSCHTPEKQMCLFQSPPVISVNVFITDETQNESNKPKVY